MESRPPTYDHLFNPFPSEGDGPLEMFLREQIIANAKVIYNRDDGSGAPGRDFFVVIASADTNKRQTDRPRQMMGYRALLVERWWEWEEAAPVAKKLGRRVLKASSGGCIAPAEALTELAEAVFRETGIWLGGDDQENLRREIDELDKAAGREQSAQAVPVPSEGDAESHNN